MTTNLNPTPEQIATFYNKQRQALIKRNFPPIKPKEKK